MSDSNQIRDDIAKAREFEKRYQALQRLKASGDFRLVFTDGLFKDKLTQCVLKRHKASSEEREELNRIADAISYLDLYLKDIESIGEVAHIHIREGLLLLDELEP